MKGGFLPCGGRSKVEDFMRLEYSKRHRSLHKLYLYTATVCSMWFLLPRYQSPKLCCSRRTVLFYPHIPHFVVKACNNVRYQSWKPWTFIVILFCNRKKKRCIKSYTADEWDDGNFARDTNDSFGYCFPQDDVLSECIPFKDKLMRSQACLFTCPHPVSNRNRDIRNFFRDLALVSSTVSQNTDRQGIASVI